MAYTIWHDRNVVSAQWFMAGVSPLGLKWQLRTIPKPGSADFLQLPEQLKTILRLDNVDLFATIPLNGRDTPVVIMEITSATPHGQHYKQRLSRVIAACQADVPFIYIIPDKKTTPSGTYTLSKGAHFIIQKINTLNNAPAFLYAYPDRHGTLVHDVTHAGQPCLKSSSMQHAFKTIQSLVKARLSGHSLQTWRSSAWISAQEAALASRVGGHSEHITNFRETLTEIDTAKLSAYLNTNTSMPPRWISNTINALPLRILTRKSSLIFRPEGRMFAHSGDPYCGMMAFFDYAFCRTGPTHEDRNKNLIYMPMPDGRPQKLEDEFSTDGYHRFWSHKTAFRKNVIGKVSEQFRVSHELQYGSVFIMDKPSRIYGYFSDMIVFDNAMLVF